MALPLLLTWKQISLENVVDQGIYDTASLFLVSPI